MDTLEYTSATTTANAPASPEDNFKKHSLDFFEILARQDYSNMPCSDKAVCEVRLLMMESVEIFYKLRRATRSSKLKLQPLIATGGIKLTKDDPSPQVTAAWAKTAFMDAAKCFKDVKCFQELGIKISEFSQEFITGQLDQLADELGQDGIRNESESENGLGDGAGRSKSAAISFSVTPMNKWHLLGRPKKLEKEVQALEAIKANKRLDMDVLYGIGKDILSAQALVFECENDWMEILDTIYSEVNQVDGVIATLNLLNIITPEDKEKVDQLFTTTYESLEKLEVRVFSILENANMRFGRTMKEVAAAFGREIPGLLRLLGELSTAVHIVRKEQQDQLMKHVADLYSCFFRQLSLLDNLMGDWRSHVSRNHAWGPITPFNRPLVFKITRASRGLEDFGRKFGKLSAEITGMVVEHSCRRKAKNAQVRRDGVEKNGSPAGTPPPVASPVHVVEAIEKLTIIFSKTYQLCNELGMSNLLYNSNDCFIEDDDPDANDPPPGQLPLNPLLVDVSLLTQLEAALKDQIHGLPSWLHKYARQLSQINKR